MLFARTQYVVIVLGLYTVAGLCATHAATPAPETTPAETIRPETIRPETIRPETIRPGTIRPGTNRVETCNSVAALDRLVGRGKSEGRLVIARFTADWCGPCKRMEQTTWRDPEVLSWMNAHAIGVRVGFDAETMMKPLNIHGIPLIIAFQDGREIDRLKSLRRPDEVLAWLRGLSEGRRALDMFKGILRSVETKAPEAQVKARYDLAREYKRLGDTQSAANEFVWMWKNREVVSQADANGDYALQIIPSLAELAAESESVRAQVLEVRAELDSVVATGTASELDIRRWLELSGAGQDHRGIVEWLERCLAESKGDLSSRKSLIEWNEKCIMLAIREQRAWQIGYTINSIWFGNIEKLALNVVKRESYEYLDRDGNRCKSRQRDAEFVIEAYALCLCVGRDEEGAKAAQILLASLNNAETRLRLVEQALDFGQAREMQMQWINQAEHRGADKARVGALKARLKAALPLPHQQLLGVSSSGMSASD